MIAEIKEYVDWVFEINRQWFNGEIIEGPQTKEFERIATEKFNKLVETYGEETLLQEMGF